MAFKTVSVNDWLISDVKVSETMPTFYTESINMKGNAEGSGLHRFNFEFSINFRNQKDLLKWSGIMTGLRINASPFYFDAGTDVSYMNPLSNGINNIVTLANIVPKGAVKMNINNQGVVDIGNVFQFQGDTKLYRVTDKDNASISFFPPARVRSDAAQPVNFFNPKPLLRLDLGDIRIDYGSTSKISLSAKEVL
ncbi:TPA: hypothetical protein RQN07_002766 [Aeromonas dhakensis]|uniref:hypothetical protein n=1 Tax=Aeromonas TaxID=642 RepID=UPI002891A9B9|nr:hypothetical protein [Aeromonas dhakensis]HDX8469034.1 hypothetical protein [Aeromonas dhakensis]HDZ8869549.1 hypothetical protein [Aeromonas dhakensis]HDZ8931169.1 hypothetical protein [Aeromonas dhakensis]HEA3208375.1 hypothetical protein [Aeromonas dhakensis]